MAGHKEDCLCPRCCMADMDAHLTSIGLDPADYPIRGAYQATGNRSAGSGKAGSGSARKPHPMGMATMKQVYWLYTMGQSKDITGAPAGVVEAIQKANETSGIEHLTRDAIGRSETITLVEAKALDWLFKAPYKPRKASVTDRRGQQSYAGWVPSVWTSTGR